jgi:putative two-component system response regulator
MICIKQNHSSPLFQILFIEDDQTTREFVAKILESWGYSVVQAADGNDGLKHFKTHPPALVLTGLKLPGINGLEVLKQIRQIAPEVPVIILSRSNNIEDVKKAMHLGACDFVSKPIADISYLEHTVHKAVARYLLNSENQRYQQLLEEEVAVRTAQLCSQLTERIKIEQALRESEEKILQAHQELMEAYDATLQGWSKAMELKDRDTEGHSVRVTNMTVRLARSLGVCDDELVMIRYGAMLHDIGKIGIPDSILLKPGPLNTEEWEIMRKHPVYAYEMLSPVTYLRTALDIPYFHHERWDGSGYPLGLKGEEIPLSARIFAVIDVWDALSSDRPYRQRWEKQAVSEHIKKLSGTQFDPRVVTFFLEMQEKTPSEKIQ